MALFLDRLLPETVTRWQAAISTSRSAADMGWSSAAVVTIVFAICNGVSVDLRLAQTGTVETGELALLALDFWQAIQGQFVSWRF